MLFMAMFRGEEWGAQPLDGPEVLRRQDSPVVIASAFQSDIST